MKNNPGTSIANANEVDKSSLGITNVDKKNRPDISIVDADKVDKLGISIANKAVDSSKKTADAD